jgi:hypothetical protein
MGKQDIYLYELKDPAASCKESFHTYGIKHTCSRSLTPKPNDYDCIQHYRSSRDSEPSRNALAVVFNMNDKKTNLAREAKTVNAMIALYCKGNRHHTASGLCTRCRELAEYSSERLAACKYGERKPSCKNCTTHCYKPEHRESIRCVMRYAGPRMLARHPYLAIRHFISALRG